MAFFNDFQLQYGLDPNNMPQKFQGTPQYETPSFGKTPLSLKESKRLREKELEEAQRRERLQREREMVRADRGQDMQAGQDFFARMYGTKGTGGGSLGSSAFGNVDANRAQEIQDIINQRKGVIDPSEDIAEALARRRANLDGLDSVEGQALREQSMRGLLSQEKSAARNLRGSLGGLRGGAAAAAQASLARDVGNQRSQLEQDLLMKNLDIKNQALGSFEQAAMLDDQRRAQRIGDLEGSLTRTRADELARQQYNQSQAAREFAARSGAELGFANLGMQERNQILSQIGAEDLADATENAGGGKKSHFCMEFFRKGLISRDQLQTLTNLVGEGMVRRGDFVYWYMKNADKIAVEANKKGFNWSEEVHVVDLTISTFKECGRKMGDTVYIQFCERMWKKFGKDVDGIEAFDQRFYNPTLLRRLVGFVKIMGTKKTWTHTPKVLRARWRARCQMA